MTTTSETALPPAGPAPARARPRRRRRAWAVAASVAVVAGVTITAGWLYARSHDGVPDVAPSTPITLPGEILDLRPQPVNDATQSSTWTRQAAVAAPGAVVVGRTYGGPNPARSVRVVAGRTDLTGKLELAWRADTGHPVGKATCTNNVTIGEITKVRPTVMLCWRTTPRLSVYSLIIDPKSTGVLDTDGAAAVDVAWRAAVKGV